MKKNSRVITGIFMAIAVAIVAPIGCGAKEDMPVSVELPATQTPTPTPAPTPEPTPNPADLLIGKAINPLTGLYIDEEAAARRPVAVVINNLKKALPQSGLAQADLYYEVLAEGGITRIIPVFQDFNSEKIGPIRSARHYFLDFALDHDAVFVHHGGSQEAGAANAYNAIASLSVNNLDGMRLEGTAFWRDPIRNAQAGMKEHSSYTSAEKIFESMEKLGYRKDRPEDFMLSYLFYDEPSSPRGHEPAFKVTVPFSGAQKSVFEYDEVEKVYKRFQNEEPQIDEETGEQLEVTNILIQFASVYTIAGDTAGRQDATLTGGGDGYLVTNGVVVPITWKKESHHSPTEWYLKAVLPEETVEEPILLNKGKTWICVFQKNGSVVFEGPHTEDTENGENSKNES